MPQPVPVDPLERIWRQVFVGDTPGNMNVMTRPDATTTVTAHVPDGGTTTRSFSIGGQPRTVEVPSVTEQLVAADLPLAEVADELAEQRHKVERARLEEMTPEQRAEQDERNIGWARYMAKEQRDADATITTERDLGTLSEWLLANADDHDDEGAILQAIARGHDHRCIRCQGTGRGTWLTCSCVPFDPDLTRAGQPAPDCARCHGEGRLYDPCLRCAATGHRRSTGTLELGDEHGNRHELHLDASMVHLTEIARTPPRNAIRNRGRPWTQYRLSITHLAAHLRDAGLHLPADGVVLIDTAGQARKFDGTRTAFAHGALGVATTFLRLLPGGSRVAHPPTWFAEDHERMLAECTFDDLGRVRSRRILLRPVRPLTEAWDELAAFSGVLQDRLPEGWTVQVWLRTGFIATGEHGPHVSVIALPPHSLARPVAAIDVLDYGLDRAVESAVSQARTAHLAELATRIITANSENGDG